MKLKVLKKCGYFLGCKVTDGTKYSRMDEVKFVEDSF